MGLLHTGMIRLLLAIRLVCIQSKNQKNGEEVFESIRSKPNDKGLSRVFSTLWQKNKANCLYRFISVWKR
jgi:hypothetical protein